MPKAKLSDEEKQAQFDAWLEGNENKVIINLQDKFLKHKMELSDIDIWDDFQPMLNALFELVQELKVPGRKAKCKFHILLTNFYC